jgi:hypothetical protein
MKKKEDLETTMEKRLANRILTNLEHTATELEKLAKAGHIDARLASDLVEKIDNFSDQFEVATFGPDSFRARQARVIQSDKDEPYMSTFDNPNKVIQSDKDESYMHTAPAGFNAKAIGTFDVDSSSTVTDRDEYNIRDLNPYAGGTKAQPSWKGGPAGKSTRQGSYDKPEKTWAP